MINKIVQHYYVIYGNIMVSVTGLQVLPKVIMLYACASLISLTLSPSSFHQPGIQMSVDNLMLRGNPVVG